MVGSDNCSSRAAAGIEVSGLRCSNCRQNGRDAVESPQRGDRLVEKPDHALERRRRLGRQPGRHEGAHGIAGGLTDVAAGLTHLFFIDPLSAEPHCRAGKIKPMLVASPERNRLIPDVPTSAEAGFPDIIFFPTAAT